MTGLGSTLGRILTELRALEAAYALVGGLAVSVRTEPRFTRDIDLAVAVQDDSEAEGLVRSLVGAGFEVQAAIEQTGAGRLATVRLRPPGGGANVVDLLFASSGIEADVVAAAEPLEVLPGVIVPVARTGHLIALKLLARDDDRRPQDSVDLWVLVMVADDDQRALAEEACTAIMARGFARGRVLVADLNALLDS
ncbi:MAG: nucleotidyl transferase AbiEii/AbiGii toxin family protein [Egibacteraceae bacterium]